MILDNYYQIQQNQVRISRRQASDFAKGVANDFNPIHDVDSKRFCVPGDLLFSLVLRHYGLSQRMHLQFAGLVNDQVTLIFPDDQGERITLTGDNGKAYLHLERSGEVSHDPVLIERLILEYVAFSGKAFPHLLVPLMESKGVMINPDRPLVIYESMALHLDRLDLEQPRLRPTTPELEAQGKRGLVTLNFDLLDGDEVIGGGYKKMVLSGLQPFDAERMAQVVAHYNQRAQAGSASG